jgi:NAD+ synthase (glutamine-hydrolysing)
MRITIAQLNYHIGNFEGNVQKMLAAIDQAKQEKADIICFSELSTCGYPPRDFLEFDHFIRLAEKSIQQLAEASKDIAIVVGSPSRNPVVEGKDLYNSVYFLYEGKVKFVQHKALLPTYDIFDEYRYFEPASEFGVVEFKGKKIALTVCEDIWNIGNENPLYTVCPLDEMMGFKPDFIINVSASPFSFNHAEKRIETVRANVLRYNIPMFYINHVGAQTEIIFDGGSIVMAGDGQIVEELPYFKECIRTYDLENVFTPKQSIQQEKNKYLEIHDALVMGVKNYFEKLGFTKAILGLSGGIDSAVTAVIAVRALGNENVRVCLMPSQFSSEHSVHDARVLAENLGVEYDIFEIKDIYQEFIHTLQPVFRAMPFNVTEENIQARVRGVLLMAMSNKLGYILLNTTNKSEMAVGYGTLYGDLCGGLSVIADVYKTEVYELARYMNKDGEVIPENTITKPPSAELRPNQKDSDSLPDYHILDEILFEYIENRLGPREIIEKGYDKELVKRILRLVNLNEFKRHQTAPVLRVSDKAFGIGRRVPIVGKYLT